MALPVGANRIKGPDRAFLVYSGTDRYPKGNGIEATGLRALAEELRNPG